MKKKTVWSFMLALALMVSAIGASTAALAAAPDTAEPATAIATENEDAIWEQIEAIEEKSDPKVLDEIEALEQEYDRICEKNADLWDKVDEAYFGLPDDYDFDNYDEISFIRSLNVLTDAEKEALVTDYNRLVEIDNRLCELNNSVWGNTGCESGICPL